MKISARTNDEAETVKGEPTDANTRRLLFLAAVSAVESRMGTAGVHTLQLEVTADDVKALEAEKASSSSAAATNAAIARLSQLVEKRGVTTSPAKPK